jgi:hypothetical protein
MAREDGRERKKQEAFIKQVNAAVKAMAWGYTKDELRRIKTSGLRTVFIRGEILELK